MTTDNIPLRANFRNKRNGIPARKRFNVLSRDNFTCRYCGVSAPDAVLHIDHIDPVSGGGGDEMDNLVTACQTCNLGKGALEIIDSEEVFRRNLMDILFALRRFDNFQVLMAQAAFAFADGSNRIQILHAAREASTELEFEALMDMIRGEIQ